MAGAGLSPAGLSFAGFGTVATVTTPGTVVYPDITTGLMQTGRIINPKTKDYTFTSDGRIAGEPTVPQLVKLAMLTQFGSACISLGIDFSAIQLKDDNFVRNVRLAISNAVSSLVQQQLIQIVDIRVTNLPQDAALAVLHFRDLTTGILYTQNVQNQ